MAFRKYLLVVLVFFTNLTDGFTQQYAYESTGTAQSDGVKNVKSAATSVDRASRIGDTQPQVGKLMPDFELHDVRYFNKKQVTLSDLKGKWVFLDFWFSGCASCIASFPEVNKFQAQYGNDIQYILVGLNDKNNKSIGDLYERFRKKFNLELAAAFDSSLIIKWGIRSMPHIFIIDPNGVLVAITDGRDITAKKIQQLIKDENPVFYDKTKERRFFEDFTVLDTNIIYRSKLYKFVDEIGTYAPIDAYLKTKITNTPTRGFQIGVAPLKTLYFLSVFGIDPIFLKSSDTLYGTISPVPILEIRDSTLFKYEKPIVERAKGYYNYSLIIQPSRGTKEYLMQIMQSDLKNNFGFEARKEKRMLPVWKLISTDPRSGELLRTKGVTDSAAAFDVTQVKYANQPLRNLLLTLRYYNSHQEMPIFDETGITGNIDIDISANMTNIEDVRKALRKYKLDIIRGEKEMLTLVISDPK